jgi:DNA helicase-2/ATP-dependent DNA helicase PcrA
VFIIGMEEGVFPHSRSLDEGSLEEERRLAYVGITRAQRDLYVTWARARNLFGARTFGVRSRFVDEIPAHLTDRQERPKIGAGWSPSAATANGGSSRGRATSWDSPPGDTGGVDLQTGDDVVHAAFGEGVVIGVEPGGVVVVRFAGDRSERKLVAAYAPLEKR